MYKREIESVITPLSGARCGQDRAGEALWRQPADHLLLDQDL